MKNRDIINLSGLSKLIGSEVTLNRIPKKHKAKIEELDDLIEYWKKRHKLQ